MEGGLNRDGFLITWHFAPYWNNYEFIENKFSVILYDIGSFWYATINRKKKL